MKKEFSETTVATVAHLINTIEESDRILVLDNVAEFDTPFNLIKLNGLFCKLSTYD